jgi:hypothetical protein
LYKEFHISIILSYKKEKTTDICQWFEKVPETHKLPHFFEEEKKRQASAKEERFQMSLRDIVLKERTVGSLAVFRGWSLIRL